MLSVEAREQTGQFKMRKRRQPARRNVVPDAPDGGAPEQAPVPAAVAQATIDPTKNP